MPPATPSSSTRYTPPQRQKLALISRNFTTEDSPGGEKATPTTTITDTEINTYIPYWPPPSLHPSLVEAETSPQPTIPASPRPSTIRSHSTSFAIAITFSLVFVSLLCGLVIIMLVRWFKRRNALTGVRQIFQRKFLRRGFSKFRGAATRALEEEPIVFIGVDYTDGNVLVRDITLDQDIDKKNASDSTPVGCGDGPPRIPPSVISAESLTLRPDYSTRTMNSFQQRLDAEEADISMAIGIAMRDCMYSGSELSTITQSPRITPVGNRYNNLDSKYRTRHGSDASDSTQPTTESEIFSFSATLRSSLTSIPEIARDSEIEDLDTEELVEMEMNSAEDMVFEVARAQAQSMEIKRGVLVNWASQRASLSPIMEETMFLTPSPSRAPSLYTRLSTSFSAVPSLVVTCPSMMTIPLIGPSFSSISVDLSEFPLPPSAFNYDKPVDEFDMHLPIVPDFDSRMGTCILHS